MIYFDSAATSFLKPDCVAQAVFESMHTIGSAERGTHRATLSASRVIYRCREQVAEMFGLSDPQRVAFTKNSTEALNIAIAGLVSPSDHVITTALEHNSVLRPLYRTGAEISILPADGKGCIDYGDFAKSLRPHTKAIICTHASNVTGNLLDIEYIGRFCREHGLLYILDASQTAGAFPIDMEKMGISVVCFTGHKSLMGPQGTGGLGVGQGVTVPPLLVGGSGVQTFSQEHPREMPTALEAGTLNAHGLAGLSAALDYLKEKGLDTLRAHEQHIARCFYDGVKDIKGVNVYGDFSTLNRAPIVALNLGDEDSGAVSDALYADYGICTRPGGHCAPLMNETFGTSRRGMVRFSFSPFNTEEEIDIGIRAIRELAEE